MPTPAPHAAMLRERAPALSPTSPPGTVTITVNGRPEVSTLAERAASARPQGAPLLAGTPAGWSPLDGWAAELHDECELRKIDPADAAAVARVIAEWAPHITTNHDAFAELTPEHVALAAARLAGDWHAQMAHACRSEGFAAWLGMTRRQARRAARRAAHEVRRCRRAATPHRPLAGPRPVRRSRARVARGRTPRRQRSTAAGRDDGDGGPGDDDPVGPPGRPVELSPRLQIGGAR